MAPKRGPAYDFNDFIVGCRGKGTAYVSKGALKTASMDFGLETQRAVADFIANGGLEKPAHANTAPRENEPSGATEVLVDSYNFYSGPSYGYIAFFRGTASSKWVIKSFKKNERSDQRNLPFAETLKGFKLGDGKDAGST